MQNHAKSMKFIIKIYIYFYHFKTGTEMDTKDLTDDIFSAFYSEKKSFKKIFHGKNVAVPIGPTISQFYPELFQRRLL